MITYDASHPFELVSSYKPTGDQPQAIQALLDGLKANKQFQVLQGATGTGKTFTIANVIYGAQRPSLVIVHNKTLAAQLYSELKELFPKNRVEYFISNFDFYRPEAYMLKTDTYIEKEVKSNMEIEMMRASAVNSLLERRDTIVVCSVASIYGLTDPDEYEGLVFDLRVGEEFDRKTVGYKLLEGQYARNDISRDPGTFSIRGDIVDIVPCNNQNTLIRITLDFDEIESIDEIDLATGEFIKTYEKYQVFPCYEHASSTKTIRSVCADIARELEARYKFFMDEDKRLEAERIDQRTRFDIESLLEQGYCSGMENYSRYFDGRKEGEMPFTIFDYFPKDMLLFVDESHVTFSQIKGMYFGDRSRKETLVEYGFRLPSCLDNRPLKFDEFEGKIVNCICTSATPGDYELGKTNGEKIEQIIRPTGLLDPVIEVRSYKNNPVFDLMEEIKKRAEKNERTLVITLTIKDAKNLTEFYKQNGLKVAYIQHEVKTLERTEIIYKLRKGIYDCVIGINLLREGLDIPEVSLIAIFDADKEGFLRSTRSLIQIVGRAARNENGHVIMYADIISDSMKETIDETKRRRSIQEAYNKEHNITPKTIVKPILEPVHIIDTVKGKDIDAKTLSRTELQNEIKKLQKEMKKRAHDMDFEAAAELRDIIIELQGQLK